MTLRSLSLSPLRVGVVSALIVAALVLSGCAGGNSPQASGSASSSASGSTSTTPSPTPTAVYKPADAKGPAENVPVPVLPEEAKAETKQGLLSFAGHWFAQLNYAYETGDASGFQGISSPTCDYCSKLSDALLASYQSGRWVSGGKIQTPSVETNFVIASDGNYQVFVQVQQPEIKYFETGGKEYRPPTPPSDSGVVMLVVFKEGAFHLVSLHPLR